MIIKSIEIEKFRAFENVSFALGKRITAISGRNATQKTTVLGMIGQPFTISSKDHPMYGCKTIDGYNFKSQFQEKFKISPEHDVIGEHKWKINLHNGVYEKNYYAVESIPRKQSGREATLRFWNAKSRKRGAGYIQLPVYFLSLSRLFPIGESGKTKTMPLELEQDELQYCIDNYRTILSIQDVSGSPSVGIEKATSRIFSGISDDVHDVFTNSAGEGNVTRIILAILSFKRLKEQYGKNYKGGILLIDELDATLYGFSQEKLVEYLFRAAEEFKIQIIFTTHSPIVLGRVNKYLREERQNKGIELPPYSYNCSIVYLEPDYKEGKRIIKPRNIRSGSELKDALNDINLAVPTSANRLNVYCEDARAGSFLKYILSRAFGNIDLYMSFIDINFGWTNYVQLAEKQVPEFRNNVIVLDGDVPEKDDYKYDKKKRQSVEEAGNFLFLPLVIEKDIFELLKDHAAFTRFQSCSAQKLSYDVCFNNWPLESRRYKTSDFKDWYKQTEKVLGEQSILFDFWCSEHQDAVDRFLDRFQDVFNKVAERNDVDGLPSLHATGENTHSDGEENLH